MNEKVLDYINRFLDIISDVDQHDDLIDELYSIENDRSIPDPSTKIIMYDEDLDVIDTLIKNHEHKKAETIRQINVLRNEINKKSLSIPFNVPYATVGGPVYRRGDNHIEILTQNHKGQLDELTNQFLYDYSNGSYAFKSRNDIK